MVTQLRGEWWAGDRRDPSGSWLSGAGGVEEEVLNWAARGRCLWSRGGWRRWRPSWRPPTHDNVDCCVWLGCWRLEHLVTRRGVDRARRGWVERKRKRNRRRLGKGRWLSGVAGCLGAELSWGVQEVRARRTERWGDCSSHAKAISWGRWAISLLVDVSTVNLVKPNGGEYFVSVVKSW